MRVSICFCCCATVASNFSTLPTLPLSGAGRRAGRATLLEHLKRKIIADYGRYRKVKPVVVLEVAFQFNPAQPHVTPSGLPLRLPRIKSIRRDKNVDSIRCA